MSHKILIICLGIFSLPSLISASALAQDISPGERLFRQRCASCHTVLPNQNRIGPSLAGVIGRKAGSLEGARYSDSMRSLDVTWDAVQLETYLSNPRAMVPGTNMAVSVPSAADRASIVAYLLSLNPAN